MIAGLRRLRAMAATSMRGARALGGEATRVPRTLLANGPAATDLADVVRDGVEFVCDGDVRIDRRWSPGGVGAQFAEDAAVYHERYFERLPFLPLVERCLQLAAIDPAAAHRVLDIGSGSGASVFPLARLLPAATIYASDISPQPLRVLAGIASSRPELRGRITPLCFDLHQPVFRADTFDLVLGCAILHHLRDPRAALANVANALRAGGTMVLVEPLESGSLVLTAMFARVLSALEAGGEGRGQLARFMRAMRLDIQSRLGPPREKPWTRDLDDKWVFDLPYLAELAAQLGLASVDVHPAQEDLSRVFEDAFTSLLADAGLGSVPVPPAVLECVRAYDAGIDPSLKREWCPTGIVVFKR